MAGVTGPLRMDDLCSTCSHSVPELCSTCAESEHKEWIRARDQGHSALPMWFGMLAEDYFSDQDKQTYEKVKSLANGSLAAWQKAKAKDKTI